jgi:hypothetical protein
MIVYLQLIQMAMNITSENFKQNQSQIMQNSDRCYPICIQSMQNGEMANINDITIIYRIMHINPHINHLFLVHLILETVK